MCSCLRSLFLTFFSATNSYSIYNDNDCEQYKHYKNMSINMNTKDNHEIPENLNPSDLQEFMPCITTSRVIKVYDGDTITIASSPNRDGKFYKFTIRLLRIDTPEVRSKNPIEKIYGKKVRDILAYKILGKIIYVKPYEYDNFGRILAEIYYDGLNMSDWLINNGYALYYDGKTKEEFDVSKFSDTLMSSDTATSEEEYNVF